MIDDPFIVPIRQVVHRGGPTFIVQHTIVLPTLHIVRAEEGNSVAKYMRLAVWYVSIQGKTD